MTATATSPLPPQNLDAEESVLGALLISKRAFDQTDESGLTAEDFYRQSHGVVFKAACALNQRGEPVDVITLSNELDRLGLLDSVGGQQRIAELAVLVPAAGNVGHYAKIVREFAGLRRLIFAGQNIARLGYDRPGDLDELLGRAEAYIAEAVAPTFTTQFSSMSDGIDELVAEIVEAYETGEIKFGLRTGFIDLDSLLTGFHPGQLILVAARPSMGKSALAQNIAENVADSGLRSAFVSLEMSEKEVKLRQLARASGIDSKQLKTGRIRPEQLDALKRGANVVKLRDGHLFVEDDPAATVQKLRAEARRLQRTIGLDVLVVDYLQLMISAQGAESRQAEISTISRGLKLLARELNIPVVALSQLNRNLESRENKRPVLSDLRDSGSLEQDADVVLFVYRDDYYNPNSDEPNVAEIIVSKNRGGATGKIKLTYDGPTTEFGNLAHGALTAPQEG